jgi:hypothetical protein
MVSPAGQGGWCGRRILEAGMENVNKFQKSKLFEDKNGI